jgi:hypothetical protein
VRWLFRLQWLRVLQWPAGLVLAGLLLASGADPDSGAGELMLAALVGVLIGGSAALALRSERPVRRPAQGTRGSSAGLSALSRVPLRQVHHVLDLRRLVLVATPVMLAAPLGATAGMVGSGLMLWLPLVCAALVVREALAVNLALRRWLASAPVSDGVLALHVWKQVLLLFAIVITMALLLRGKPA